MRAFHSRRDEPEPSVIKCLEWIAPAQQVLVVGFARESLLRCLDARGCTIAVVMLTDSSADEARVYCSEVHKTRPEELSLRRAVPASSFDAVVLDRALDLGSDPSRIMADVLRLLRAGGSLVVLGMLAGSRLLEPISNAGYEVRQIDHFSDSDIDPTQFALLAAPAPTTPAHQAEIRNVADLQDDLRARDTALCETQSALSASKVRVRELERELFNAKITQRKLQGGLEAETLLTGTLEKLLESKVRALASAREETLQAEMTWRALQHEVECLRAGTVSLVEEVTESRNEVQAQRSKADRMAAAEAVTSKWAEELQQNIFELRAQIAFQTKSEAEAREQLTREVDLRERLSLEVDEVRHDYVEAARRAREEIHELRARVADAERALATQTDALIDSMRTEGSKLSTLIDTVQSSRFWRFKRWLNRLRGNTFPS